MSRKFRLYHSKNTECKRQKSSSDLTGPFNVMMKYDVTCVVHHLYGEGTPDIDDTPLPAMDA